VAVAAAADLRFAMDELIGEFRQQHADIELAVTYGSSGNLHAQLLSRAPFDIYFAADRGYPRQLVEKGLADSDSELLYAVGHIVVWVPRDSTIDVERLGMEAVVHPAARKVAMANPQHAPYGRAAEDALKSSGLYERVRERLVLGDNIAQTAQFVESGAADVGILSLSLATAPALRDKGRFWLVPGDAYPPLEQSSVIMNWVGDRAAAEAFRAFVTGHRGRQVLRRYGFQLPHEG